MAAYAKTIDGVPKLRVTAAAMPDDSRQYHTREEWLRLIADSQAAQREAEEEDANAPPKAESIDTEAIYARFNGLPRSTRRG